MLTSLLLLGFTTFAQQGRPHVFYMNCSGYLQNPNVLDVPFSYSNMGPGVVTYTLNTPITPPFPLRDDNGDLMYIDSYLIYPVDSSFRIPGPGFEVPVFGPVSGVRGGIQVKYAYEMTTPNTITVFGGQTSFCNETTIEIQSSGTWPMINDNVVKMTAYWQYQVNNGNWIDLGTSTTGLWYTFDPWQVIPELANATSSVMVRFRCKEQAVYPSLNKTFNSPYSIPQNSYYFYPTPPVVESRAKVVTPACYGMNNGQIFIPGSAIRANTPYIRWILRPGNVTQPCDPGLNSGQSNCGDMVAWSNGVVPVSGGINIQNVPKGDYTLWVLNPGQDAGNCYVPIPLSMTQLPDLTITNNTTAANNVHCFGGSDGSIVVTGAGGNGANTGFFYTLLDNAGQEVRTEQQGPALMTWTGLRAGTYTAVVRDGTCATLKRSVVITITQPPQITASLVPQDATCLTPGNGLITVNADPGVNSYIYQLYQNTRLLQQSGPTAASSYTFSGLAGGDYTVNVLNNDYPGCTGWTGNTLLNGPDPIILAISSQDSVTCNGGSDGAVRLSSTGGMNAYRYTLTRQDGTTISNNTGNFTGLSAGNYMATVSSLVAGCNDGDTKPVTIYQRTPISISLIKTDISCNGAGDGKISAVVSGGSYSYSYQWEQLVNGVWQTNSFWFSTDTQIDALQTGDYRLIITDNKSGNCSTVSGIVTIAELPAVKINNVVVAEAICMADGAPVTIDASGGDGSFIYSYTTDNSTYTNFNPADGLHASGTYRFSVTDGEGCKAGTARNYTVELPALPLDFTTTLSNFNGFNISCADATDGEIMVNASGGNGGSYTGYQYRIASSQNNTPYQSSALFTNLAPGEYAVSVKDARGCEITKHITLTVPALKLSAAGQDIACNGQSAGIITYTINGGAPPYELYVNGQPAGTLTNLPEGTYQLHATDANHCTRDTVIEIKYSYDPLQLTNVQATDVVCFGETGKITWNTGGGDGNYTFTLNANPYTNGAALTAGVYELKVTDGHGCLLTYPDPLTITAPATALNFTAVLSDYNGYNISCAGGANGFADITATGGNGNSYQGYTFALDNNTFSANASVKNINAGLHQLKVQDGRGCIVSQPFTFTESSQAINLALSAHQDVHCANLPNGSFTVNGSGGTGALSYSIDGNSWQSSTTFNNLKAGAYTVIVKDLNTCQQHINVTINSQVPAIIIDNADVKDITCYGGKGAITIDSHGGGGTLTTDYSLNGGAWTAFNNNTLFSAGSYIVRVADTQGCYSDESQPLSITTPTAPLTVQLTVSDYNGKQISCFGKKDGSINITAAGGNGAAYTGYQYSVNGSPYTAAPGFNNLEAGAYTVKVMDARGCEISQSLHLQQADAALQLSVTGIQNLDCGGIPTGKIELQASGGIAPYLYTLNDAQPQTINTYDGLLTGNYNVQVTDINGCAATNTAIIQETFSPVKVTGTVTPVDCNGNTSGVIALNVDGGKPPYAYSWNIPDINLQQLKAGTYEVTVTDAAGCVSKQTYEVTQPALLQLTADAPSICDGMANGVVTLSADGGTTPYSFQLDNASSQNGSYTSLSAGNHQAVVTDGNGCSANQTVNIGKLNVMPNVDFLVATSKNAFDTLIVKEICFPAPDDVSWSYDPQTIILGSTDGAPLIKYAQQGQYWIEMLASFGPCTYSQKKTVTINPYDPIGGPSYTVPVKVIDTVLLSPNPNNGNFKFTIKLNRRQLISATVFDLNGRVAFRKEYPSSLQIDDQVMVDNTYSGVMLLRVVSENESRDVRFIIVR